jgi:hypothetical protein
MKRPENRRKPIMRSLERQRIALSLVLCGVTMGASSGCSSGAPEAGAPEGTATDSSATTAGAGGATAGTTTTGTSTASLDSPPIILSFDSNVQAITQGEQVTFTAVVTDPDGAGDIAFGDLLGGGTGIVYGAFTAGAQQGTYELALSWSQINQLAPIDFGHGASEQRPFVGRFFDHAGRGAARTAAITLQCNGGAACSGTCVGGLEGCGPAWSACLPHGTVTTCVDYCASVGSTCSGSCTNPYTGMPAGVLTFDNATCTYYAPGFTLACAGDVFGYEATRCCCGG